MKELTARQREVLGRLDAEEWRGLEGTDGVVAGRLCKPFRPDGPRYVKRSPDPGRPGRAVYRLTRDGVLRLRFESTRP